MAHCTASQLCMRFSASCEASCSILSHTLKELKTPRREKCNLWNSFISIHNSIPLALTILVLIGRFGAECRHEHVVALTFFDLGYTFCATEVHFSGLGRLCDAFASFES